MDPDLNKNLNVDPNPGSSNTRIQYRENKITLI
jgi:hypothetical protein